MFSRGFFRTISLTTPSTWGISNAYTTVYRALSSLVLAEQKQGKIQPSTFHAISAAKHLGGPISVLLAGHALNEVAKTVSTLDGVDKVLVADDTCFSNGLAEPTAALIQEMQKRRQFTHIIASSTTYGRNILPRAAALLDIQAIADVISIKDANTFVRPIYAGNAIATVKYLGDEKTRCFTIRPIAFPPIDQTPTASSIATIENIDPTELKAALGAVGKSEWIEESSAATAERPELGQAKVVISGGRALKSKENFAMVERLADLLGGAVGASRAAVDAGYAANDLQVGQTGKVVAPDIYIAIGISGAIQHVAGMKDSKVIVSINSDGEAPIFQISDYGLVGDLFKIVPELEEELKRVKG